MSVDTDTTLHEHINIIFIEIIAINDTLQQNNQIPPYMQNINI